LIAADVHWLFINTSKPETGWEKFPADRHTCAVIRAQHFIRKPCRNSAWTRDGEFSRYGLPLCVLTRFRAFHDRSFWAFFNRRCGLLRPSKDDVGLPRHRDYERRRIKKPTMRQVGPPISFGGSYSRSVFIFLLGMEILIMRLAKIGPRFIGESWRNCNPRISWGNPQDPGGSCKLFLREAASPRNTRLHSDRAMKFRCLSF
jgi:hypothetical protein